MALAGSALGLSLLNKDQLRQIKRMLDNQEEEVQALKTALQQKVTTDEEIHSVLIEQTNQLYCFVRELRDVQASHHHTLTCLATYMQLQTSAQILLEQIKATMQYVNQGQLSGKLTPIRTIPEESNRRFYTDFPNISNRNRYTGGS